MTWKIFSVVILIVLLVAACLYTTTELALLKIRCAFAEDQCEIFEEMRVMARNSQSEKGAVDCLNHVVNYYPSGTKQVVGSRLDKVVELQRACAIKDIIAVCKSKTGADWGDDPLTWIEQYRRK